MIYKALCNVVQQEKKINLRVKIRYYHQCQVRDDVE